MTSRANVSHGFMSLTEVEPGHHQSYNEWHLFDHMPEQFPLPGIVFGQRWVLTPALRAFMSASPPLDRVHYATLYLLTEPIEQTLTDFRALAGELRDKRRFHLHRTSHLSGPLAVRSRTAASRALVSAEALPYRPNRGVRVSLSRGNPSPVVDQDESAGSWTFTADHNSPTELQDTTATWTWLDGDPAQFARSAPLDDHAYFSATFASVDPWAPWDWFDD